MKDISLYIHIPFCKSKCFYCDFNSYSGKEGLQDKYVENLIKEMDMRFNQLKEYRVKTIYVGGGTPTYLNMDALLRLLSYLKQYSNGVEYTWEANPGTLTDEKLHMLKEYGVNRLSIGLQSWDDDVLKILGRIHNVGEFVDNFNSARRIGFDNINVDIMSSIGGQSIESLKGTLDNLIRLAPEHISCYSLIIEEGTVFGERAKRGELHEVDEDTDYLMYKLAINKLRDAGYVRYEISNHAKPGFKCMHNIVYWKTADYLGVGAGAHSLLNGTRFSNEPVIEAYTDKLEKSIYPVSWKEKLTEKDMMGEFMFMGLRMMEGISIGEFEIRFGKSILSVYGECIKRMEIEGLIEISDGRLFLTERGIDVSNRVFMEFV